MGATLDPGVAFLMARGLKTYYLRYERHSQNAQAIAECLATRKEVRARPLSGTDDAMRGTRSRASR